MNDDLPENMRKLRVNANYSQEYVAETIGVSLSSYARYEGGKVPIDFYSVAKLAELYRMTIDELYHYGDPDYDVTQPKAIYQKKSKVYVTVELDGDSSSLDVWIKKLTVINEAVGGMTF